jgi:hypothetical protein
VVALVVVGYDRGSAYVDDAYTEISSPHTSWGSFGMNNVYRWARPLEDKRIAVTGTIGAFFQYPLYGRDLSNHVQFVGREADDGSFDPYETCAEYKQALADGDYDYVVVTPDADIWDPHDIEAADEAPWTVFDRAARKLPVGTKNVFVFELTGDPDPRVC